MREPVEGGGEQTGDKEHHGAEGDLQRDQGVHQAAPRVRAIAAFQRRRRLDGGSAQSRNQPEQEGYGERQRRAECEDPPIETLSAISRVRAAACAVNRLATLAQATSNTNATITPRAHSGRR